MRPAASERPKAIEIRLFGPPALLTPDGEIPLAPRRPHQLLALLACRRHGVPRAELAELFWPDRPEGVARGNLRVLLQRVQQGPVVLDLQAERVRWPVDSDLARFEDAALQGRHDEALASYGAPLLEGLEPGLPEPLLDWLADERQRLQALWRSLRPPQAVPAAERAAEATLSAAAARADPEAFIGRRAERAELARRLQSGSRVIAVLGPGGVGKTALLRAALAELAPRFGGGAAWVSLTDLTAAEQVPARIARALGLTLRPAGDAWAQLQAALADGDRLLVLDNAEHLEALDAALAALQQACPGLRLLIGSRRRPALDAVLLPLEGLPLPDDEDLRADGADDADTDAWRHFDAVRLFEARARAASPGFTLAGPQAPPRAALHAVLRATEGLPLALELAAAALRLLPLAELAQELGRSTAVLDEAAAPGPGRGLRAGFERSWALLDDAGRRALSRLAWLPGAFGRTMALQVCEVPLAGIAALVDRSLLQADTRGRLRLHPLLRQWVQERHPAADAAALAARHAEHVDHLLTAVEAPQRLRSRATLDMLDDEMPHLRAAWAWTVASSPPMAATRLARLARQVGVYHVERGGAQEILPWLEEAVQRIALPGRAGLAARAVTLRTLAMLQYHRGALALAQQQARQALRWAGQAGDTATALSCLTVLGNALVFAGQAAEAQPHFERARRLALERQDLHLAAAATNGLGLVERAQGRLDAAAAWFLEGGRIAGELGEAIGQVVAMINAGNLLTVQRRWDEARRLNEAALAQAEAAGLVGKRAILHTVLAEIALATERRADARRHVDQALAALDSASDSVVPTQLRLVLSELEIAEGRLDAAGAALAEGLAAAQRSGSTTMQLSAVNAAAALWAAQGMPLEAARLWQTVIAHEAATPSLRDHAAHGLQRLPAQAEALPIALPMALPMALPDLVERLRHGLAGPDGAAGALERS